MQNCESGKPCSRVFAVRGLPSENEDIKLRKVKTTKTITLQFPMHMLPLLKCRAKAMGLSLSAYFTKLLREELKRRGYLKH